MLSTVKDREETGWETKGTAIQGGLAEEPWDGEEAGKAFSQRCL